MYPVALDEKYIANATTLLFEKKVKNISICIIIRHPQKYFVNRIVMQQNVCTIFGRMPNADKTCPGPLSARKGKRFRRKGGRE